eukprot:1158261-Pelagomonas_calceolata.AAC.5
MVSRSGKRKLSSKHPQRQHVENLLRGIRGEHVCVVEQKAQGLQRKDWVIHTGPGAGIQARNVAHHNQDGKFKDQAMRHSVRKEGAGNRRVWTSRWNDVIIQDTRKMLLGA